jgi:hypothetical protein
MKRPNIFNIATKELSQDAFITWLLQYSDDKFKQVDEQLNSCGKTFIRQLILKQLKDFNEPIEKVKAGRQWNNIDVWAEVNDKYLIIIEDKTNTSHHSNQLQRYKTDAEKWCLENNYEKPVCIYLKTGNESQQSLNEIKKHGFSIFSRLEFIGVLEQNKEITNDIFIDFLERLKNLERLINEFEIKPLKNWNGSDWQGFFQFLEKEIKIMNWNYVNNPSGGFWNAILNWDYWGIYPFYIQLEEGKLCFKVSTDPEEPVLLPENTTRAQVRNNLHNLIMKKARHSEMKHIRRPNRFGNGNYMTVAIIDRENWLGNQDEILDKEKVIDNLKFNLSFLREIINN